MSKLSFGNYKDIKDSSHSVYKFISMLSLFDKYFYSLNQLVWSNVSHGLASLSDL